eukprot:TRINITY_DN12803_c0_g1_i1.p1 TRINITY_DN12803_c0_g1~~TRINITY_DN12803_c0_g1_i1.p1  ORF type:complete len:276 (-),score=34.33 TRINITY_DN12803_c0_g1_i1:120-947(-)
MHCAWLDLPYAAMPANTQCAWPPPALPPAAPGPHGYQNWMADPRYAWQQPMPPLAAGWHASGYGGWIMDPRSGQVLNKDMMWAGYSAAAFQECEWTVDKVRQTSQLRRGANKISAAYSNAIRKNAVSWKKISSTRPLFPNLPLGFQDGPKLRNERATCSNNYYTRQDVTTDTGIVSFKIQDRCLMMDLNPDSVDWNDDVNACWVADEYLQRARLHMDASQHSDIHKTWTAKECGRKPAQIGNVQRMKTTDSRTARQEQAKQSGEQHRIQLAGLIE